MGMRVVTRIYHNLQWMRFLRMQEPKVVVAAEVVILRQSLSRDPPLESASLTPFPNDESFCDALVPQHRPRPESLNPSKALPIATYTTLRSPTRLRARAPSIWQTASVSFALGLLRRTRAMMARICPAPAGGDGLNGGRTSGCEACTFALAMSWLCEGETVECAALAP